MKTTQDHLPIEDISSDLILLKDGGASLVLQSNAINFGLLSQIEQIAIISGFAQMLNSLSFAIQIVIISTRLDISSYLQILDQAIFHQKNSLLKSLMANYRNFIQSTIKENEVLDKKFYLVISVAGYELGLKVPQKEDRLKKIKSILWPRRDQLLRQLNRFGLKAQPLKTAELIKLYYNLYNPEPLPLKTAPLEPVRLQQPVKLQPTANTSSIQPLNIPQPDKTPPSPPIKQPPIIAPSANPTRHHPFIVEELTETV